jgi:hypothetical protein
MYDPFNVSGMFGTNSGPGAFMDPNGKTGGAIAPGKSLQSVGINGNPLGIGQSGGASSISSMLGGSGGSPAPPPARPPMTMQNMGQQAATPQPRPAPQTPQPQNLQQKQAIQSLMQALGGTA